MNAIIRFNERAYTIEKYIKIPIKANSNFGNIEDIYHYYRVVITIEEHRTSAERNVNFDYAIIDTTSATKIASGKFLMLFENFLEFPDIIKQLTSDLRKVAKAHVETGMEEYVMNRYFPKKAEPKKQLRVLK